MKQGTTETADSPIFQRFSTRFIGIYALILVCYVSWITLMIGGIRNDHLIFIIGASFLLFFNDKTRKLVFAFGFIMLYWVLFDSIRIYPNIMINPLHIAEPYLIEKAWFGISMADGTILTPNEYLGRYIANTFLDIYTAITYISWIPAPLAFSMWMYFSGRQALVVRFLFMFFMVSMTGVFFQYCYPAAPPWYVELYGFTENLNVPGNPGRLINFDHFFNVNVFGGMYSLNGNVFAAIPSLHCAFPVIQFYFATKHKIRRWQYFFILLMLSTWFAAVYTNHHYTIDVIAGIGTAILVILVYDQLLLRSRVFNKWMGRYGQIVS